MTRLLLIAILLSLLSGLSAETLRLKNRCETDRETVTLADVVHPDHLQSIASWADYPVARLPWGHHFLNLGSDDIQKTLRSITGREFQFSGTCVVRRQRMFLDQDHLRDEATAWLIRTMDLDSTCTTGFDPLPEVTIPHRDVRLRFELVNPDYRTATPSVRGMVIDQEEIAARFVLHASISQTRRVCITKTTLRRGDLPTPDKLEFTTTSLPWLDSALEPSQLQSIECDRYLPAGTILTTENTRAIPPVKRGDRVQVVVRAGGIRLTTTAIARQTGHIGDTIACRDPETREEFQGTVSGPDTIFISMED